MTHEHAGRCYHAEEYQRGHVNDVWSHALGGSCVMVESLYLITLRGGSLYGTSIIIEGTVWWNESPEQAIERIIQGEKTDTEIACERDQEEYDQRS